MRKENLEISKFKLALTARYNGNIINFSTPKGLLRFFHYPDARIGHADYEIHS